MRRHREGTTILNVRWWPRILPTNAVPQEIPIQLGQRPVFFTYSDGEGS